jgi:uncharacterized damage-inducible protein DinB
MGTQGLRQTTIAMVMALALASPVTAQAPARAGQGWLGEFEYATGQLLQLAEAIPAEKFAWRPAPGVRSISELYMHIAIGNYLLLGLAGLEPPVNPATLGKEPEKSLTRKAEVVKFVKESFDAVRAAYPGADKQKVVKFGGVDATAEGVFLRLLVHNHEHMGQAVAYARTNGIVPPWSKAGGQ